MNIYTDRINQIKLWLDKHPKAKEWFWFIALWLFGLCTVLILSYPLKLLMKNLA